MSIRTLVIRDVEGLLSLLGHRFWCISASIDAVVRAGYHGFDEVQHRQNQSNARKADRLNSRKDLVDAIEGSIGFPRAPR